MARTVPVHTGYTIINGAGTGPNGHRIDVWVEYLLGQQNVAENHTPITAYFYAALNPNYTSTTHNSIGLSAAFALDGMAGTGVTNGAYNFTSSAKVNLLGSFSGQIPHDDEGNKTLTVEGSFTTRSSYITGGNIRVQISLPSIPRAAQVTAEAAALEGNCHVSWTPAVADHSFFLTFSLGQWHLTTDKLFPNTTQKVIHTDTVLPLEAARYFPGKEGTMSVTLTTCRGEEVLGSHTATFPVTVPENAKTCPEVSAILTPECVAFPGMYVQHLGKVSAAVTATDPLDAEIQALRLTVGTATWENTCSDFLEQAGTLPMVVTAVSSRGFSGTWEGQIQVLPYDSPRLTRAEAYRCLSDGTADPGGTFLALQAEHRFSSLQGVNTGMLLWRYKPEDGPYGPWQSMASVAPGVVLEKNKAYTVQISTRDTAGGSDVRTLGIPAEQVYMHRTKDAMGLGGYAEGSHVLDLYWDLHARKGICGAYIRRATGNFTLRFTDTDNARQGAFLLGGGVFGLVTVSEENAAWEGTEGVSVTLADGGVAVTLPQDHGLVLILSPDPMEI